MRDLLGRFGLGLADAQLEKLACFVSLLEHWTAKVDLVSPAPREILITRHIADSLAASTLLAEELALDSAHAYLDVGSGAGLPGIVMAVAEPARRIVLAEPREKRVAFLREVRRTLQLQNVAIVPKRLAQLDSADVQGVGLVIERALGMEDDFLETSACLVGDGSTLVQMVGPSWQGAVGQTRAWADVTIKIGKIMGYNLSEDSGDRRIVVWNVSRETLSRVILS